MTNPLRIVSLLPSATEIVAALGKIDCLVGRSHECDFPRVVERLPICCRPRIDITRSDTDINRVRQKIGMVFQSFNLYPHMSALGNVTIALRKVQGLSRAEADAKGMAALERVGLAEKAKAYPNELSGGQQQRVGIARSLALEPLIVLFDEPTSALDPELVGSVLKVMQSLRESGMTMVVVSHEMGFARAAADRVVFMDDGLILEQGAPDQVFGHPQHARAVEFIASISRHH